MVEGYQIVFPDFVFDLFKQLDLGVLSLLGLFFPLDNPQHQLSKPLT